MIYLLAAAFAFAAMYAGYGAAQTFPRWLFWLGGFVCLGIAGWGLGAILATMPGTGPGLLGSAAVGTVAAAVAHERRK